MKKHAFIAAVAAAFSFPSFSQQCQWAQMLGGAAGDMIYGLAVDSAGNSYAGGFFSGIADFGFGPVASCGGTDLVLIKKDPSGATLWARTFGGSANEEIRAVAVASDGSVYASGRFSSSMLACSSTVFSNPDMPHEKAFLLKFDASGMVQWGVQTTGSGNAQAYAIACLSDRVAIAGSFEDTLLLATGAVASYGSSDAFVALFQSNGALALLRSGGGVNADAARGISFDVAGSFIVAGDFNFGFQGNGQADFGACQVTSAGFTDAFLAKYDSSGNCLWARNAGGSAGDQALAVAVGADGISYITGLYAGLAHFGSSPLFTMASADAFIAAYDSTGVAIWASRFGSTSRGSSAGHSIAIDPAGNPVAVGGFESGASQSQWTTISAGGYDIFMASFDHSDGSPLWMRQFGGADEEWACATAYDRFGRCFIAGASYDTIAFDAQLAQSAGQTDGFIACFGSLVFILEKAPGCFSAYPNPCSDGCMLAFSEPGNYSALVISPTGQTTRTASMHSDILRIDRNGLASGLYIVRVYRDGVPIGICRIVFE